MDKAQKQVSTLFDYAEPLSTNVSNPNIDELLYQEQAQKYGQRIDESGSIGPMPEPWIPNPEEALLSMTPIGGALKIKSLADMFRLAEKYPKGIPAYLRQPPKPVKPKGFRKVGITRGSAIKDDILAKAMERFDRYGNKIPPSRQIEFKLDK